MINADEAGFVVALIRVEYTAIKTPPELYAEQPTGFAVSLEQATPPAQLQWSNLQPLDGVGRFAVAPKLVLQATAD